MHIFLLYPCDFRINTNKQEGTDLWIQFIQAFNMLHAMYHEATACHVTGDIADLLLIMLQVLKKARTYTEKKSESCCTAHLTDFLLNIKLVTLHTRYNVYMYSSASIPVVSYRWWFCTCLSSSTSRLTHCKINSFMVKHVLYCCSRKCQAEYVCVERQNGVGTSPAVCSEFLYPTKCARWCHW